MNLGRAYFGGILVALGVLFLLDTADVLDAGDVIGAWWPILLIGAAALQFFANPGQRVGPAILALIGLALLVSTTELVDVSVWGLLWPTVIIIVGISLLIGRKPKGADAHEERVNSFVAFSGKQITSRSQTFEGGSVSTMFGGTEIDLRQAGLAPGAALDVFNAFGGTEVKVPTGWKVIVRGLPLFGGFENATNKDVIPDGAPTLVVNATVLFGGLEVKH